MDRPRAVGEPALEAVVDDAHGKRPCTVATKSSDGPGVVTAALPLTDLDAPRARIAACTSRTTTGPRSRPASCTSASARSTAPTRPLYFDELARRGHTGWGLVGVGLRRPEMREALAAQDGLYTVVERGRAATTPGSSA